MRRGRRRVAAICHAGSAAGTEAEAGGYKSHLQHIALQSENLTREELRIKKSAALQQERYDIIHLL